MKSPSESPAPLPLRLVPAGVSDHSVPGGALDELARIVANCCAPVESIEDIRGSLHSAHEVIRALALRIRALEDKQEADRASHAARLRTLERR